MCNALFLISGAVHRSRTDAPTNLSDSDASPMPVGKTMAIQDVGHGQPSIIMSKAYDNILTLWDVQTGKIKQRLPGKHGDEVTFSPDGKTLAVAGWNDASISFWNPETGKLIRKLAGSGGVFRALAFSPDGKTLIRGNDSLTIWDLQSNKVTKTLKTEDYNASIAFSPEGSILANAGGGGNVLLWNTETWELKSTLESSSRHVRSVAFSPDGELLAVASAVLSSIPGNDFDHDIRIWDVRTGNVNQILKGHSVEKEVNSVAFSPDGKFLATGSSDRTVKLWDTHRSVAMITGYVDVVEASGSGCRIRIISGDKLYIGVITFGRLSMLTGQTITTYEDAVAALNGKQITLTLANFEYLPNDANNINFGNAIQLRFPVTDVTNKTTQTWNERNTATETIIDLSTDILFDFDKSIVKPDAIPSLIKLARLLRQSKNNAVQLNGFTDSIGTDEYNIGLSQRRAEAVKQWLVTKGGIDAGRLNTNGYGKAQPVAPNTNADGSDNPAGRQKNRRVEIRIPRN